MEIRAKFIWNESARERDRDKSIKIEWRQKREICWQKTVAIASSDSLLCTTKRFWYFMKLMSLIFGCGCIFLFHFVGWISWDMILLLLKTSARAVTSSTRFCLLNKDSILAKCEHFWLFPLLFCASQRDMSSHFIPVRLIIKIQV